MGDSFGPIAISLTVSKQPPSINASEQAAKAAFIIVFSPRVAAAALPALSLPRERGGGLLRRSFFRGWRLFGGCRFLRPLGSPDHDRDEPRGLGGVHLV